MTDEKKAFVTMDVVALERLIPRHAYVGDLTLTENLHNYIEWLKAEVDHWKDAAWRAAVAQDEARAEVERLRKAKHTNGCRQQSAYNAECVCGADEAQRDLLRTVAERQREACAAYLDRMGPRFAGEAAGVRATPLVTEGEP